MDEPTLSLTISYRGASHTLAVASSSTTLDLSHQIESLTSVPPHLQKLIYAGKKASKDEVTLGEAGLKDGMKIQLLGPKAEELSEMQKIETKKRRVEGIMNARAAKAQKVKVLD